ncbi:unnamed protein product, partial [Staurois parvus]
MGTDWHNRWALTGGTDWQHCIYGHWWAALLGTGRWHFWAQVGGTAGHRWVHCLVALLGTGGRHFWAQVGGTGVWHCWAPIIRALIISALMIGADPHSDNCRVSAVLSSRSDSVRKVQQRTGNY